MGDNAGLLTYKVNSAMTISIRNDIKPAQSGPA